MSECPDPDVLSRFSRGLTIDDFDAVCKHVTSCSKCAEQIDLQDLGTEPWIARARESAMQEEDGFSVGMRIGRAGELLVVRKIGQGGMAQVWQAYQPDLDRFLAVKISRVNQSATCARLAEEAKVVVGVSHPNIVAVHDFFLQEGQPVIVMDYVDGCSLSQRFESISSTAEIIFDWVVQLLAAVNKLHQNGVTHGDLKPHNLLIDRKEKLYVADFGLSSSSGSQAPKVLAGTLYYAAPEQATRSADRRSDIYSLGKILEDLTQFARCVAEAQTAVSKQQSNLQLLAAKLEQTAGKCVRAAPEDRACIPDLHQDLKAFRPQLERGPDSEASRWIQLGLVAVTVASLMAAAWAYLAWPSGERVRLFVRSYTSREVEALKSAFEKAELTGFEYVDGDFWVPKSQHYDFYQNGTVALRSGHFDDEKLINALFSAKFESRNTKIRVILDTDHQTKIGSAEEALQSAAPIVSGIELVRFHPDDAIKVLELTSNYRLKQFYFEDGTLEPLAAKILVQQPELRECYITGCCIEDEFVEILSLSTTLTDFFSIHNPITDNSIEYLCRMSQLGAIGLRGCPRITAAGLRTLLDLDMLRWLEISEGIPDKVIDEFTSKRIEVTTHADFPTNGERAISK